MSIDQLTAEAMALPPKERVALAHALLDSADAEEEIELDPAFRAELRRRCEELDSGKVKGIPHEEVMEAVRRAIQCA